MPCSGIKGIFWCAISLGLLSGCATVQAPPPLAERAGMHAVDVKNGSATRVSGALHWSAVDVIDVKWRVNAEVDEEQTEKLCAALRDALRQNLQPAPPSEGRAIQVRARIIDVVSTSPVLNVATTLLLFVPLDRGGASVEIDAVDQATGQPLASLTLADSGQLGDFPGHFSRFSHAEDVLRRSASAFRQLLEKENEPARSPS